MLLHSHMSDIDMHAMYPCCCAGAEKCCSQSMPAAHRARVATAGQLPTGMTPLVNSNTNVENFAPTGAEGVPNAPLFVPYQGKCWAPQLPACAPCLPITSKLPWLSGNGFA